MMLLAFFVAAIVPALLMGGFILYLLSKSLREALEGLLPGLVFFLRYLLLPLVMLFGWTRLLRLTRTPAEKPRIWAWVLLGTATVTGILVFLMLLLLDASLLILLPFPGLLTSVAFSGFLLMLCEHLGVKGSPLWGAGLTLLPLLLLPVFLYVGAPTLLVGVCGLMGLVGALLLFLKLQQLVHTLEQPR